MSVPPESAPKSSSDKAGRLALSSGEVPVAPRWCTWAYIEGESSMPNAVSSDLVRFENDSAASAFDILDVRQKRCLKEVSYE